MDSSKRKRMRLEGFDYNQNGAYFLTLCSKDRKAMFSSIVGRGILDAPVTKLTSLGKCVENSIDYINQHSDNLKIDHYVVMPNHVHLLVSVQRLESDAAGMYGVSNRHPAEAVIPKLISSLKRYTNRACGIELWQSGYYDHIIRDERDYRVRWEYIYSNPARWAEDEYYHVYDGVH